MSSSVNDRVDLQPVNQVHVSTSNGYQRPKCKYCLTKNQKHVLLVVIIVTLILLVIMFGTLYGLAESDSPKKTPTKEGGDKPTSPNITTPTTTPRPAGPWDNIRLPRSIIPSHYDIHFDVDPNKDGYNGQETISINVTQDNTRYILIHSNGLNITHISVKRGSLAVQIYDSFDAPNNSFHVIRMIEVMPRGNYELALNFTGKYRTSLYGLFKGVYRQQNGKDAAFISSHLQPLDARTVFPCFDEPALKATFKLSYSYPKDMVGLSNNEIEKEDIKENIKTTYYKITPKMSTYLVSIVVGHFEYEELMTANGVRIRVYAQPGNKDHMDFSLKMGSETLTQMEDLFGKYPMKKLDFVATPEVYIAMENWGSIRFDESNLLYKKGFSSEEIQQDQLIRWLVHEVVHMWFGNMVTTKWWNDLWLNEGITDFFTYHDGSPKSIFDWRRDVQFLHSNLGYALELDGLINSRAVVEQTPVPTMSAFDDIIYKKGSAILYMVKDVFPKKENFNAGMKKYFEDHTESNVVSDDLWVALQSKCPLNECLNFTEIMKTWMTSTNYPVLTVKKEGEKYIVQQERFVYDKTYKVNKTMWPVRFSYIYSNTSKSQGAHQQKTDKKWLVKDLQPLEKVGIEWNGQGWIKGNAAQKGFYRVNYDNTTWASLASQLHYWHKGLNDIDRYGLIDDAFNLVRGGRLGIETALSLTTYLDPREKSYMPWLAIQRNFDYILSILPDESIASRYVKRYLAYQCRGIYKDLGFDDSGNHIQKLQRMIFVGFQCNAGSISCLKAMKDTFDIWKGNPLTTSVTPALRKYVYFYGVRQGTPEDWEQVLKQLKVNTIASEYQPLLMGLAGSRDKWTIYRTLNLTRNERIVKEQYVPYLLDDVANHNPDGSDVTWTFLRDNWQQLKGNDPIGAMLTYLPTVTKRYSTTYRLSLLEKFINENLNGKPMPRLLRKTVEIVKLNIAWRKEHEDNLVKWLTQFFNSKNLHIHSQPG